MSDSTNKSAIIVTRVANVGYFIGCTILFLLSLWIIAFACWSIIKDIIAVKFTVYNLLDEVGLIVFSIAVIDVAKYLMIEEVIRKDSDRSPHEERRTFSKFATIIATALFLEGLVLTIEVAKTDVQQIFYPVSVLITATLIVIGLGVYQRLNASAEKD
jgi:hypothetical protein